MLAGALRDLPLDGEGPAYAQIYRSLRAAILSGRAPAGGRLPATRSLASDLGVSRTTVLAAYDQLLAEGDEGAGAASAPAAPAPRAAAPATTAPPADALSRFGRALQQQRPRERYEAGLAAASARFDFRPCVPDLDRLPDDRWRRSLSRRALYAPTTAFDYPDPAGAPELRRELAAYLGRARGVVCQPDQVLVVSGVSQALDLAARLFLDDGDGVLLEEPGYLGAARRFEAGGAHIVPGPVDDDGLSLDAVDPAALETCRLAYVTPSHQFPTGSVMSLPRRLALLDWAARTGGWVIEDDYDSEFRYEGRAIEALKSLDDAGRVLYVGTLSKTLFPSMRIAYLVVPGGLRELFRDAKFLADFASPVVEQLALADFLSSGDFERHVRRARTLYGRSRRALLTALDRELGDRALVRDSQAGLHVHVTLPGIPHRMFRELAQAARAADVGIYSAGHCYRNAPKDVELVFGFTRLDEPAIDEGIRHLANAISTLRTGQAD